MKSTLAPLFVALLAACGGNGATGTDNSSIDNPSYCGATMPSGQCSTANGFCDYGNMYCSCLDSQWLCCPQKAGDDPCPSKNLAATLDKQPCCVSKPDARPDGGSMGSRYCTGDCTATAFTACYCSSEDRHWHCSSDTSPLFHRVYCE